MAVECSSVSGLFKKRNFDNFKNERFPTSPFFLLQLFKLKNKTCFS